MVHLGNSIKVSSANCQGLQNKEKRQDVVSYFRDMDINIVCLQDTHWTDKDLQNIRNLWGGECFIHGVRTNSRGVAILIKNNFEYEVLECNKDKDGNFLQLLLKMSSFKLNLMTIYGPNNDNPDFFKLIQDTIDKTDADYSIVCGDFNLVLNPLIDAQNYKHINNPKARTAVLNLMENYGLTDILRYLNPWTRR